MRYDTENENGYDEHDPSDDYALAQFIQQEAAKVVKKLEWMTKEKSAWMVWERFRSISEALVLLRDKLEVKHLLEVNYEDLTDVIKDLERGCIEYDGEDCLPYFGYYIRDYADVLTKAIVATLSEKEQLIWEINE
jgi:hypothetical protein